MSTTRRTFLASGASAGAAMPLLATKPGWLEAVGEESAPSDNILVVVQIRGGWDALQILPEVEHPSYIAARPDLKLLKNQVLPLQANAAHYWHPAMRPFKDLLDRGDLATIENIGYPGPSLSHFLSEKKWYAADPATSSVETGWLSSYLEKGYPGTFGMPALNLESRLNPSFLGSSVPVFTRVTNFQFQFDGNFYARADNDEQRNVLEANGKVPRVGDPNLVHLSGVTSDAVSSSALLQSVGASYAPKAAYPNSFLANSLQIAARYITGGLQTQIYYTSRGGFDTHANEIVLGDPTAGTLANNLSDVAGSVKAFLDDIKAHGKGKNVVVMLFSEFARRLGENGSLGTDHGHGGLAFLAGEPVVAGRYGNAPDLSQARTPYDRYYIPFDNSSTDFRSLFATVIQKWFGVNHQGILGGTYPLLGAL